MPVTVFGNGAVQTAYVSFTELDITVNNITLVWPTSYFNVPSEVDGIFYNVLAASMAVTTSNIGTKTITLPDATESSVGSNFIITNRGLSSFTLKKSDGSDLIVIPNTISFWVQLTNNSTAEGEWKFIQFGAGTSEAQASDLAGNGLFPIGNFLNTNISVQEVTITPHNVSLSERAKLLLWKTGAGQMNLPEIASPVPNGFYISVNNEGSGILTIIGNATIDDKPSVTIAPGQSLSIISDGVKWWSLGFGQHIASSDFISGSPITPSITFIADPSTGIYYQPLPVAIGFSVGGSLIANINALGLSMNLGKNIILRDVTNVSDTALESNASYGQISWNNDGLVNFPTLRVSGTEIESRLTLGPFSNLTFSQSLTNAIMTYNSIGILNIDNTGESSFKENVTFEKTTTFTLTATFNGQSIFNDSATFNGAANFIGAVTLTIPLPIASGGTGQTTQQTALNALMPPAPVIGDLAYYDGANWIRLPIGNENDFLKVIGGIPAWTP